MARPTQGSPLPTPAGRPDPGRGPALAPGEQFAALTGAAVTLTQQIAALTGAVAHNTAALAAQKVQQAATLAPPGPGAAGPGRPVAASPGILSRLAGSLTGGLTAFAAKVVAPLAPLAVLGQLLGHANSGFGAFLSTTKLITASLAGFLMPGFVAAAGVLYAIATIGSGELLPLFVDLAKRGLKLFAEVVTRTQETLDGLDIVLNRFGMTLSDLVELLSGMTSRKGLDQVGGALGLGGFTGGGAFDILGGIGGRETPDEKKRRRQRQYGVSDEDRLPGVLPGVSPDEDSLPGVLPGSRPGDPGTTGGTSTAPGLGDFADQVRKGMDLALKQIQRDLSPKAQQESLVQAYKSAQMAALNADPIGQETLRIQRAQLEALMELIRNWKPPVTH